MGECIECALRDHQVVWGRFTCECGNDFCVFHANGHREFTGHEMLDKRELMKAVPHAPSGICQIQTAR